jgi:ribonuclease-3
MERCGGQDLCERLGYTFANGKLFELCLTHSSFANENPTPAPVPQHNERLEFLGDAVLDLVISDFLFERFPELSEGALSKLRASLVAEGSLAEVARELRLGERLRIGRGEELSGGRDKSSILSDALEALLAGVYLDSRDSEGIAAVRRVIAGLFERRLAAAAEALPALDYKTELQERMQKTHKEPVRYRVLNEDGPDHDKTFEVAVTFHDRELGRGRGRSKKQAEQAAAQQALQGLHAGAEGSPP